MFDIAFMVIALFPAIYGISLASAAIRAGYKYGWEHAPGPFELIGMMWRGEITIVPPSPAINSPD